MKYLSYILRLLYWRRISGIQHLRLGGFIQVSKKNTITLNGRSFFGKGCYLGANIQAEGDLLVGPGVFFVGGDHRIPQRDENQELLFPFLTNAVTQGFALEKESLEITNHVLKNT